MKTKKLLALLMAGAMSVSMLSGCGGSAAKTDDSSADAADTSASAESDIDYVKSNGKLVIGITDFAPMDIRKTARTSGSALTRTWQRLSPRASA